MEEKPVENNQKKLNKRMQSKLRQEWIKDKLMEYVGLYQPVTLPVSAMDNSPEYASKKKLFDFVEARGRWEVYYAISDLVKEGRLVRNGRKSKHSYIYSIGNTEIKVDNAPSVNTGIKTDGKCPRCGRKLDTLNTKYEFAEGEDFTFEHCSFCGQDFYPPVQSVKEIGDLMEDMKDGMEIEN